MTETTTPPIPRWRLITFWVLLVVLLFLHLGERPQQLSFIVTAFGGFPAGEGATHEMHWFAQGVFAWSMVAAVAAQLRRPAAQVGAAWVYGAGTVLAFVMVLALADLPAEVIPIIAAAIVIAALAFVAHPSSWRAKFTSVTTPSRTLFALAAVAAVPSVVYAVGQLDIHLGSGPHDEHYAFGHWVVMAVYALLVPLFGAVAAWKVSGWRFPLWVAGIMAAALGVGSLGMTAVSQLTTTWSLLAIAWGAAFIAVGELEARQPGPHNQPAPTDRRPVSP
ncbi:MAG: hypothetical protein EA387_01330 [Nitriliruptor sp.]|nr:MAG: hypothetical protein EA387_01330 [Nitriliruptor sp.]